MWKTQKLIKGMNNKSVSDEGAQKKSSSPSFIKLAMKNMVRKGGQSLFHFGLTAFGFISFILLIAILGKPNIPQ